MRLLIRVFARLYLLLLRTREPEVMAAEPPPPVKIFHADTNYPFY